MLKSELHFLIEIRCGIASHCDCINVGNFQICNFQTFLNRELWKACVILYAVQPLLGDGHDRLAVNDDRGRRAGVKCVNPQNDAHKESEQL